MQNDDLTFFNTLKIRLKEDNQGEIFHEKFLPKNRDFFSHKDKKAETFTQSAVMLILFSRDNSLKSLLIERATYPGVHSGQISFPGGKQEISDQDLLGTAIRETFEEISATILPNQIIGSLSPLAIPISKFTVFPYVCLLPNPPHLLLDQNEVASIIEFDVWEFIYHASIKDYKVIGAGTELLVPAFNINGHIVWGATAMILNEFREIAREILNI